MSSVYLLTSPSGKQYVGKTSDFSRRMWQHSQANGTRKNSCRALYSAIRKYGWENFTKEAIAATEDGSLCAILERWFIKIFDTRAPKGYNLTDGGEGKPGAVCSEVTRAKMRKPKSEEHRDAIRRARTGVPQSESAKEKIRATLLGKGKCKAHSEKTRLKISHGNKGKVRSEETRAKISAAKKGKPRGKTGPLSEVHRAKLRAAWARSRVEGSTQRKTRKGYTTPEDTRLKLSESAKLRWAKARELRSA